MFPGRRTTRPVCGADPPPASIPSADRAALFAALMVHDDIHAEADLPGPLHVPDPPGIARNFRLSHQVWLDGVRRRELAALAIRVARGQGLDPAEQRLFKDVRARFKQLRFAFVLLDRRHRSPACMDRMTRLMGSVQDALRHGRASQARAYGWLLRLHLCRPGFALLLREARDFRPATPQDVARQVEGQLAAFHADLAGEDVAIPRFHAMRKVVSRLVAFYDSEAIVAPSSFNLAVKPFLSTVNGLMGSLHDELVERKLACSADYHAGRIAIPPEIARRLRTLVERGTPVVQPAERR